jgi:hypothetical protein
VPPPARGCSAPAEAEDEEEAEAAPPRGEPTAALSDVAREAALSAERTSSPIRCARSIGIVVRRPAPGVSYKTL